jgi:hypothetical protein
MTESAARVILQQALSICRGHDQALGEALEDLGRRNLSADELERLGKEDRRLLDQFAYRYTRLQDDMGAKLFPAALRALGEDVAALPMIDRLARLEQIGWLPSADEWAELRRIRNQFSHEYPESATERFERLHLAIASAYRLREILAAMDGRVVQRWPDGLAR